jgi:hypothetical protein
MMNANQYKREITYKREEICHPPEHGEDGSVAGLL